MQFLQAISEALFAPAAAIVVSDVELCARFSQIPPAVLSRLVMHRGLHATDDSLARPLENTQAAYERAWAMNRAHHCECDVTMTTDGDIVLSHDDTFERLAFNATHRLAGRNVVEHSTRELMSLPLKDGSRAALLKEVLAAAARIGEPAHLVVEIKGKDQACARKLAKFLSDEAELARHVSVVMGFDPATVHAYNAVKGKVPALVMLLTQQASRREFPTDACLDLANRNVVASRSALRR